LLHQIGHLPRHHRDDAKENHDQKDHEGDINHQDGHEARPAVTLQKRHQALQQVGDDDTGQSRGQHVAHGKHHGEPHYQGRCEEDDLGIGEMTPEPVGYNLHG